MVWTDYLLALPITLLTLFALGILLIDFMLPKEMKWANAVTAMIGVLFSAAGVYKIQLWMGPSPGSFGLMRTMLVDRFALYFWYLFLAGTAVAILMSVRYLETEHENHGEGAEVHEGVDQQVDQDPFDPVRVELRGGTGDQAEQHVTHMRDGRSSPCSRRSPVCYSRSLPFHSTSGRPTLTKARPLASPDSCPSPSRLRDGPCCSAFLSSD